jgi:hypothetical protein
MKIEMKGTLMKGQIYGGQRLVYKRMAVLSVLLLISEKSALSLAHKQLIIY